jgi:hypothetical protein
MQIRTLLARTINIIEMDGSDILGLVTFTDLDEANSYFEFLLNKIAMDKDNIPAIIERGRFQEDGYSIFRVVLKRYKTKTEVPQCQ